MSNPYLEACPEWAENTNRWIYAGFVSASLTLLVALLAVMVLYAEGYRMLQSRIMLGLFAANAAFSLATVLLSLSWFYRDVPGTVDTCLGPLDGAVWGSSPAVLVGRGLEPSSLFMSAVYEIGLMVASIVTLKKGLSYVTDRVERRCHTVAVSSSVVLAICAMVMYSESGEEGNHIQYNTTAYLAKEIQYMQFFRLGALCGLVPACLAVLGMWLYLRYFVAQLMDEWEAGRELASAGWRRDHWDTASKQTQGLLRNKGLLLDLQREAWLEVARPLQKYCVVFLVFSPVYFVMATEMCAERTVYPTYVKCMPVCSVLISVRSLATVLVFFADKPRRDAVYNVRALLSKCWRRLRGTCARRCGVGVRGAASAADRIAFADELEDVREFQPQAPYAGSSRASSRANSVMSMTSSIDTDGGVLLNQDYHLMEDA